MEKEPVISEKPPAQPSQSSAVPAFSMLTVKAVQAAICFPAWSTEGLLLKISRHTHRSHFPDMCLSVALEPVVKRLGRIQPSAKAVVQSASPARWTPTLPERNSRAVRFIVRLAPRAGAS